jgi:hypothetical protein
VETIDRYIWFEDGAPGTRDIPGKERYFDSPLVQIDRIHKTIMNMVAHRISASRQVLYLTTKCDTTCWLMKTGTKVGIVSRHNKTYWLSLEPTSNVINLPIESRWNGRDYEAATISSTWRCFCFILVRCTWDFLCLGISFQEMMWPPLCPSV